MKNLKLLSALFLLSCATQLLSKEQEGLDFCGWSKRAGTALLKKVKTTKVSLLEKIEAGNDKLNQILFSSPEELQEKKQKAAHHLVKHYQECQEIYINFNEIWTQQSSVEKLVFTSRNLLPCIETTHRFNALDSQAN